MPNTASLTVSGPSAYSCTPSSLNFPNNTKLTITPPSQGCTIIFSQNVDGHSQYDIQGGTTKDLEFKTFNANDVIKFCTCALNGSCDPNAPPPNDPKADTGHTITISTSTK